jgi:hypothetical protein
MAVRDNFAPGEVLTAGDLNDTFADKQVQVMTTKGDLAAFGTTVARLGVGSNGAVLTADSAATLGLRWSAGQKILQIVRATDTTSRSTTSTSYVDVTGMSVTITPQKNDSAILILAIFNGGTSWTSNDAGNGQYRITDSSNNAISGAQNVEIGSINLTGVGERQFLCAVTLAAWATPGTTSATTYKLRFQVPNATTTAYVLNGGFNATGQMYAIEVSA